MDLENTLYNPLLIIYTPLIEKRPAPLVAFHMLSNETYLRDDRVYIILKTEDTIPVTSGYDKQEVILCQTTIITTRHPILRTTIRIVLRTILRTTARIVLRTIPRTALVTTWTTEPRTASANQTDLPIRRGSEQGAVSNGSFSAYNKYIEIEERICVIWEWIRYRPGKRFCI